MFFKNSKGFTLYELIVVLAITSIIVAAAVPVYGNFQGKLQLLDSSADIVQILRTARGQSLVGYNDSAHGVYFVINNSGVDSFVFYQGDSYTARNQDYDQTTELKSVLAISNSSFTLSNNNIDINFTKGGLGLPNNTGSLILSHSITGQKNISVNSFGMVEKN
ncbi:MAG: prepilin-type N-terminal cleavage/methylation domain-containing protein [Patescibacteria group bacterium]|nr:prepilin-type N-terminal cleavage/methylation domain-containing protein [Patescibacteria group bacterium]